MSGDRIAKLDEEWKEDLKKPVIVDKWNGYAVKYAIDDVIRMIFMKHLHCVENHNLMNMKLIISTIAVLFSCYSCAYDYIYPFPKSSNVLMICSISYFFFIMVWYMYTMLIEKDIFMQANEKDIVGMDPDNLWRASSTIKKYDDIYKLRINYTKGTTNQQRFKCTEFSIATVVDVNGQLRKDLLVKKISKIYSSIVANKKE